MLTAIIAAANPGDNEIVPAVAGKKIRVYGGHISFGGTVNIHWRSDTTPLTGLTYGAATVHVEIAMATLRPPGRVDAYFETAAGAALNLNLSGGGVAVGGFLNYEYAAV